jgi:hypothetical protein
MVWHKKWDWFHRSRNHAMVRSTGRAVRHTSKAVHRVLLLGMGLLVVACCLLAGAAWRLSQGPIDLRWLSDRVKTAFIDDTAPVRVSFDGVFLVWEGFDKGVDYPFDIRLSNIVITDPAGRRLVAAPSAHLTFSLAGLLLGRFVPRAIEVDHAQFTVTREATGTIDLATDLAEGDSPGPSSVDLARFREQLSHPASSDHGRSRGLLDQIRRVHFHDTEATLRDRQSGLVLRTTGMDLDLIRAARGHVRGVLRAPLSIGDQKAELAVDADWAGGSGTRLDLTLTPFRPSGMGTLPPALTVLTDIDLPVSLTATAGFDADFKLSRIQANIQLGQGLIHVAQGSLPVRSGTIALSATPETVTITEGHFDVAPGPEASAEIVDLSGTIVHAADRLTASVTAGLSQINVADLPKLWPQGIGGGARPWVMEHVTAGKATRGTASFTIESDDALHDVVVTQATGDLDGTGGTFTWIDNVPAVEQTDFHLHLVDPDTLDIFVSSAHQRVANGGADLLIKDGQMRITGLSLHDQIAVIHTAVEGPVASALALLKEPRLQLLSTHPIAVQIGDGDASATLDFQFPLENKLQMDDVQIQAAAHLTGVRLLDVAGGQDLNGGVFDMQINKDGLTLKGQGSMATVPVSLNGTMDFTPGPADQVIQKITLTGQPSGAQLVSAGLPVADFISGTIPLSVVMIERRGGDGSVAIDGNLTPAALTVHPLAWNKPQGSTASASAMLLMSHDRLTKIDKIAVRGDGLLLTGSAAVANGHVGSVALDEIRLGQTHGHGTIQLPVNQPVSVVLQGDQLDLSAKLTEKTSAAAKPEPAPATKPDWTTDDRFDHVILANGENARDVRITATGGGALTRLLTVTGTLVSGSVFSVRIEPRADKRHLVVDTKDAGSFLRGVDAIRGMRSGHLLIDGVLDTPLGLHPMTGTATIDDVVVRNSPALGKLLQAITLYGLVDALRGPGMNFAHIVVPFRYDGTNLDVNEAHAANSSLGLTATGRIGVASGQTSITGTIVPAYFFNSMLGHLPLVGKLFSPEQGGGVFAARFGLSGQIDDPSVSINPISALTPGFLRGIFGVFDRQPAAAAK